jgi:spermidine synthase
MRFESWLKKITSGNVIFETTSPVNGKIQVVEDLFEKRLVVGGLTQSGGQVERLWKKALSATSFQLSVINRVLILGLGAGTLAKLVSQKWPRAKITGIEIDPKIIKLGKKYFALDKIPNLQITISDAAEFVSSCTLTPKPYTLVFLDLYISDQFPSQCETEKFLKNLTNLLAPGGLVAFNRLFYKEHKEKAEVFLNKLRGIFETVRRKKIGGNLLILANTSS